MYMKLKKPSRAWGLWLAFWLGPLTIFFGWLAVIGTFLDASGNLTQRMARWWGRSLLFLCRIPVQVEGLEHLKEGQNYIFAANHRSNFDIYALQSVLPRASLWVAKRELFKIPVFGQIMSRMGYISIDRDPSNLKESIRNLQRAAAMIRGGRSMVIFPEGTRVAAKELAPFKKGVFIMAHESGQPLVPVAISGTIFIQSKDRFGVRPGPVKVVFCPPIATHIFKNKDDLMAAVRAAIAANYDLDFPYGPGSTP
jgi:1-acyl-sn-glycerol-3-phosphate acyltransferase